MSSRCAQYRISPFILRTEGGENIKKADFKFLSGVLIGLCLSVTSGSLGELTPPLVVGFALQAPILAGIEIGINHIDLKCIINTTILLALMMLPIELLIGASAIAVLTGTNVLNRRVRDEISTQGWADLRTLLFRLPLAAFAFAFWVFVPVIALHVSGGLYLGVATLLIGLVLAVPVILFENRRHDLLTRSLGV